MNHLASGELFLPSFKSTKVFHDVRDQVTLGATTWRQTTDYQGVRPNHAINRVFFPIIPYVFDLNPKLFSERLWSFTGDGYLTT